MNLGRSRNNKAWEFDSPLCYKPLSLTFNLKIMGNYTRLLCDLHEIASETSDAKTRNQLLTLWTNVGHIKRAEEALYVGSLHSEETLIQSRKELNEIFNAKDLYSKVI